MKPTTVETRSRARAVPWLVALAASTLGACAHDLPAPLASAAVEYRVGRDDVVEVQVWKEPALSAVVPVRPDGRISLPMAGDLIAEGRTTGEIRAEVTSRLAALVPAPSVSVMVREVRAARFYVLGEVAHPGAFPLSGALTVVEAVALAGGATEFARTGHLVLLRRKSGSPKPDRYGVSLDAIVKGLAAPVPLSAGDTIFVP